MVSCDCCGQNVIEIKCPFCVKDSTFDDIDDKTFYLKRGNDDQLKLDVRKFITFWITNTFDQALRW
jgi:hypothetical protein